MSDQQETLQRYVSDMLSVEQHILEPLDKQAHDERFQKQADARLLVEEIARTTRRHIDLLESHLKSLGASTGSPIKKAATAALGLGAAAIDKVRSDTVSTALRDDYTALNLAAISYAMLHTTGLALKSDSTATLAEKNLRDDAQLIMRINQVIPAVVARELADEGEDVNVAVGPLANSNIQQAWQNPDRPTM
jgi:ferritin-like metal-binding protein YciE